MSAHVPPAGVGEGAVVTGVLMGGPGSLLLRRFVGRVVGLSSSILCSCAHPPCDSTRWIVDYDETVLRRFGLRHWCGIHCERSLRVVCCCQTPTPVAAARGCTPNGPQRAPNSHRGGGPAQGTCRSRAQRGPGNKT